MDTKTNHDSFIAAIDTVWKQWAIGLTGIVLTAAGPVIAGLFRTPPGVAMFTVGLLMIHFAIQSSPTKHVTKSSKK